MDDELGRLTTRERYALSHSAQILDRLGYRGESKTISEILSRAYDAEDEPKTGY